ncbi:MAG TPA: fused MFS/spermidine synthase [Pirellulales bacterium]
MPFLFTLTIFAAAALVFLLEPMVGKLLLPAFGGAPAVWNVCMAFFQSVLLAAYGYAHWQTRAKWPRVRYLTHMVVLTLPWLVLPFGSEPAITPDGGANPTWTLLAALSLTAGLPFFVVAATSPLLAQWFADTRHRHASDPYYLYAASNAGSLLGLLIYPTLVEPRLTLPEQCRLWAVCYAVLMILLMACTIVAWQTNRRMAFPGRPVLLPTEVAPPSWSLNASWLGLAFVPSSLLLGVTAHLSSDVSPVPLIWVAPLALYLLSFVLVFSRLPRRVHCVFAVALPPLVMWQIFQSFTSARLSLWLMAVLDLATFFCAAMLCHGELARRRPAASQLTRFYFWMSLGGVLGGMFNALAAPLLFNSLLEYPLAMSAACLCSPLTLWRWPPNRRWLDLPLAALIGLVAAVILFQTYDREPEGPVLLCLALCCGTLGRPLALGCSLAAMFLLVGFFDDTSSRILYRERNFYGVLTVHSDARDEFHYLKHGRILHGRQRRGDDPAVRDVPLVYYYPTGPIGQVFAAPPPAQKRRLPVAAIGLGVGSLAAYARRGQEFVFYEVDPAVERIARNDAWFTYLRDSRTDVRVELGDARLSLRDAPDGHYGLMVIDAFSGDAIPVHLLTREALRLYLSKLAPDGLLAFHISNNFLELAPVLGNLARDAELIGLDQNETGETISDDDFAAGKAASHWVIVARHEADFGELANDDRWRPLAGAPELPLWTDHSTSLWGVAHWRR